MNQQTHTVTLQSIFIPTPPPLGPRGEVREAVERVIWHGLRPGPVQSISERLPSAKIAATVTALSH